MSEEKAGWPELVVPEEDAGRPEVVWSLEEVSHPEVVASEEGAKRWSWPRRREQRHFRFGKKVNLRLHTYVMTKTHPSISSLLSWVPSPS